MLTFLTTDINTCTYAMHTKQFFTEAVELYFFKKANEVVEKLINMPKETISPL